MRILITGIASGLGRLLADTLIRAGHELIGVDRRPWPDAPAGVQMFRHDVRKRPTEEVFRVCRPDAVVHLATIGHLSSRLREERFRINLQGTRQVLGHAQTYGVKRVVFVSRHTVYGAAPDAPLYRTEAEPPLAASTLPALADLVAADLYAGSAIWRFPGMQLSVLRLVYTLGPSRRGSLARYLTLGKVPVVMGFDPLFHFMHEADAATAIRLAVERELSGVFNVAGPQPVPLSKLCQATGCRAIPIPERLLPIVQGRFGLAKTATSSLNHLKYPIVVDGQAFARATGFTPRFDEVTTLEAFRWS